MNIGNTFYPGQAARRMLTLLEPYVTDEDAELDRVDFLTVVAGRIADDVATAKRMIAAAAAAAPPERGAPGPEPG